MASIKTSDSVNNIIKNQKITLNSISLQFNNTAAITNINCFHLNEEKNLISLISCKPKWELLASQSIHHETDHVSFHFLQPSHKYKITFYHNQNIIAEHEYICTDHDKGCDLNSDSINIINQIFQLSASTYISSTAFDLNCAPNHKLLSTPMCLSWITNTEHNDADWMWFAIAHNEPKHDASFLKILLLNSLFALPHGSVSQRLMDHFGAKEVEQNMRISMLVNRYTEQVMLCPNPKQRQVIDFRTNAQRNWSRNKKLKRYKKEFYVSVNYKFKKHLQLCKRYHIQKQRQKDKNTQQASQDNNDHKEDEEDKEHGTWITKHFIDLLDILRNSETASDILHFVTFELWERQTNEIVAASFGYIVGSALCDYTFMTLKRDNRSCGSILTKVIGDILQSCGYDLWYWGFRLDYMTDYDKYGGKEISRTEFGNVLTRSCRQQPKVLNHNNENVLNIVDFIKANKALIEPLPEWLKSGR